MKYIKRKKIFCIFSLSFFLQTNAFSRNKCVTRQELVSRTTGIVERYLVSNGDMVKPGKEIIELDNRLQKAALKEAQGALAMARAQLKLAQDTYQRLTKLIGSNGSDSISQQQEVESKIRVEQATAQVTQAEGALQRINAQLQDTTIRAQVHGVVMGLPAMIGISVQPGTTLGRIEIQSVPSECQNPN